MKRYYYEKKNGKGYLNLITPIQESIADDYNELTEEEYNAAMESQKPQSPDEIDVEMNELLNWFKLYDVQVAQYNRCIRLGIEFSSSLGTIEEMDELAVQKANRIKEIRELKENN